VLPALLEELSDAVTVVVTKRLLNDSGTFRRGVTNQVTPPQCRTRETITIPNKRDVTVSDSCVRAADPLRKLEFPDIPNESVDTTGEGVNFFIVDCEQFGLVLDEITDEIDNFIPDAAVLVLGFQILEGAE
jgi:hypothetical protein